MQHVRIADAGQESDCMDVGILPVVPQVEFSEDPDANSVDRGWHVQADSDRRPVGAAH